MHELHLDLAVDHAKKITTTKTVDARVSDCPNQTLSFNVFELKTGKIWEETSPCVYCKRLEQETRKSGTGTFKMSLPALKSSQER